ncbi:MAG: EFR1 family ferrodoxin [Desulfobacterota bacterium]|nr:EFR1 family ferrodoxin [Thermodesulfobacteriota bacterium]
MEFFIVYSSPAGSTKKVARAMNEILWKQGMKTFAADLADPIATATVLRHIAASEDHCLCIGSPVYACHAVPPVTSFIAELPAKKNCCAVPFITWGCVTSGLALYEMAEALVQKGYHIAGAASLPAEHSMLWQAEHPLGKGRPDEQDIAAAQAFITKISKNIADQIAGIEPTTLNYQPELLRETMRNLSLDAVREMLPRKTVDATRCTQCNICMAACPAAAITLDPYPTFGPACFLCYRCVRLCPEHAIMADFSTMEAGLRQRAAMFQEKAEPRFFFKQ